METAMVGLVRARSLGLRPVPFASFCTALAPEILVDVQSEAMHCFVHGCLVRFIEDDSGAEYAAHIADRSALAGNPRTRIKHPLRFHVEP